mgnify:CR=1 FL=1
MLIQIITVEGGKRPRDEIESLAGRLGAAGHEVVVHRFAPAGGYAGRSGRDGGIVEAIWESDRACFEYARARSQGLTLVLEEDCEIEDASGVYASPYRDGDGMGGTEIAKLLTVGTTAGRRLLVL